jgi:branched-chain amino acid transport system substrate-binding protein
MKLLKIVGLALAAPLMMGLAAAPVQAQTVRVGFVTSMSGPSASIGEQMDRAVRLYMQQNEASLAPIRIEIIRRDDTGPNPEVARRLTQELITRERVQLLTGYIYTPNAMAIAPLINEARVPAIIMNAGTSVIVRQSPMFVRTSFTMWQSAYPLGQWTARQQNVRRSYTLVSDYAPGHDSEAAFVRGFTEGGGQNVASVRMPMNTVDFAPFLQRVKDERPDALFIFVPAGVVARGIMKAYADLGLAQAGIRLVGQGDITPDEELPNMTDVPTGIITMHHYSAAADRPANRAFVEAWQRAYGASSTPSFYSVGAWDAMAAIFYVVREQRGQIDPDRTMQLLRGWQNPDSPRGPIRIDPDTRDIVQNEYLRSLDRVDGRLINREIETIPMVSDPWVRFNPPQR